MFLYVRKQICRLSKVRISQKVKGVIMRNLGDTIFHMKTNISWDFHICISVPLRLRNLSDLRNLQIISRLRMCLNIWKGFKINFLKTQICFGVEVYMRLLATSFSNGGLFLENEFHYLLCANLVVLQECFHWYIYICIGLLQSYIYHV